MTRSLISPNLEICFDEDWQRFILKFPDLISRDQDHDPRLTLMEMVELRYLLDQAITNKLQIH